MVVGVSKFGVDESVAVVSSLNVLCKLSDRRVLAVFLSDRLVLRLFICVLREAWSSVMVEIMEVVCSRRTEKDSSIVVSEELFVALDEVTILWMHLSSGSTRVKSWVMLGVVDVASDSYDLVFFTGGVVVMPVYNFNPWLILSLL